MHLIPEFFLHASSRKVTNELIFPLDLQARDAHRQSWIFLQISSAYHEWTFFETQRIYFHIHVLLTKTKALRSPQPTPKKRKKISKIKRRRETCGRKILRDLSAHFAQLLKCNYWNMNQKDWIRIKRDNVHTFWKCS